MPIAKLACVLKPTLFSVQSDWPLYALLCLRTRMVVAGVEEDLWISQKESEKVGK
jgi:hypothetical protein